jgi:hypothetical protein
MGLLIGAITFFALKSREPKQPLMAHANRELDGDILNEEIPIEDVPEEELDDVERALLKRRRFHQQFRQSQAEGSVVEYELSSSVVEEKTNATEAQQAPYKGESASDTESNGKSEQNENNEK